MAMHKLSYFMKAVKSSLAFFFLFNVWFACGTFVQVYIVLH